MPVASSPRTTTSSPSSRSSTAGRSSTEGPDDVLRGARRRRLRGLRRPAGRRRGGRGRHGRLVGRDASSTPRCPLSRRSTSTTATSSATRSRRSPARRPASSRPTPSPSWGSSSPDAVEVLVDRAIDVGARVVLEGTDFGVTARTVAVGGQQSRCAASRRSTPTSSCRCTAPTRRRTPRSRWRRSRPSSGAARRRSTSTSSGLASRPWTRRVASRSSGAADRARRRRAQPGRGAGAARHRPGLVHVRPARRVVAVMKDKEAAEILEALEPVLDEVVVTQTSSPRAMSTAKARRDRRRSSGKHWVYSTKLSPTRSTRLWPPWPTRGRAASAVVSSRTGVGRGRRAEVRTQPPARTTSDGLRAGSRP